MEPDFILPVEDNPSDSELCHESGANSCIVKPASFQQLVRVVKEPGLYWLVVNEPPSCRC